MAYLNILKSERNLRYYNGSTVNLNRIICEHEEGKSRYTKFMRPFKLVFNKEYCTIQEARLIKYKLKKKKSRIIIEKIIETGNVTIK